MPITTSAKKALRQAERRRTRNQERKTQVKTAIKVVEKFVASKQKNDAEAALKSAYQVIDKAAKNHIMHKNKASRLKSRLAKLLQKIAL